MSKPEVFINSFATSSFRNVADQDYIAARICYKNGLMLQFAWMAQQAIEKYFKAILLYNKISTKNLGHNLKAALDKIEKIENMNLDLSDDVHEFISYINDQGPNRYLDKQHFSRGMELLSLDRAVWEIRRYCKVINHEIKLPGGETKNIMQAELNGIRAWSKTDKPHKFILVGGHLEKVISNKKHPQRDALIWANFYYGKRKKNKVRISRNMSVLNPVHINHPEYFNDIEKLVFFPKEVKQFFKN